MPANRYFIESELKAAHRYKIEGKEFHHLAHVMRHKVEDEIELVNGQGFRSIAWIRNMNKEAAVVEVQETFYTPADPYTFILAQAACRSHRLEFILEKGTELGATAFWLFPADYSDKKNFKSSEEGTLKERFKTIAISAMKQCGRLYLPLIELKPPLREWPKQESCALFYGDVRPIAPLFYEILQKKQEKHHSCCFLVGPEGGFSEKELALLSEWNAQGVRLHRHILRAETAALAALSVYGQFSMKLS